MIKETLLLSKNDVKALINMPDTIQAVEYAYKAISQGGVVQPDYMTLEQTEPDRGSWTSRPATTRATRGSPSSSGAAAM